MLDPNVILQQVGAGTTPPTWRVLRARTSYFIGTALLYGVFGLAALGAIAYIIISGTIFYYGAAPDPGSTGVTVWFIIDLVVLLAFTIIFLVNSIGRLINVGTAQQQMLVLTPEGFVAATPKGTQAYPFAAINGMTATAARGGDVVLAMRRADTGKQIKYTLDGRFGTPKPIASSILAAQGQYATAMAQSQVRPPQG
ncbi:MAG: hypothetical protein H0X24_22500 [Ktedonobacterales bacterium]|nr:hypothetical protein [Ktedonobacterales bacterium]